MPASAVVAVLLVRLFDESAAFLPAAALESFRADLGLTYAQAGTVLALIAPGALIGTVFAAAADRYSRRVIAAGGAFGFAACLAAFAAGGSFLALAIASLAMGVASTAMVDAAEVALVDMAGDDLRSFLARGNLLATVGDLAGPALVTLTALLGLSWRASFWVGSVLIGLYGCALAASPLPGPRREPSQGGGEAAPSPARIVRDVIRDRRVWVVGVMSVLLAPFDEPLLGFAIALLERERDTSTAVATLVTLVGVSGGFLSFSVLARRLADVPDRTILVVSGFTMTVGAFAVAVVRAPVLVAGGIFVAAVGLSLAWLALQHRTLTLRPGQVGTTKAVVSAIELAGFMIPALVGAVADAWGLVSAVGVFSLFGVVFTLAALASTRPSEALPVGRE